MASAAPHGLHTLGTNVAKAGLGRIAFTTNRTEIGWVGMPILVPFVRPAPEPGDDFLLFGSMAGIIPTGHTDTPALISALSDAVASEVGAGTEFTVRLPRRMESVAA